jgi:hypothetical protein
MRVLPNRQYQDFHPFHLRQVLAGLSFKAFFTRFQKAASRSFTSGLMGRFTNLTPFPS